MVNGKPYSTSHISHLKSQIRNPKFWLLPASPSLPQDINDSAKECGEYYHCGNKPYGKDNQHTQFQHEHQQRYQDEQDYANQDKSKTSRQEIFTEFIFLGAFNFLHGFSSRSDSFFKAVTIQQFFSESKRTAFMLVELVRSNQWALTCNHTR